jgi:hypothetical protein
MPYTNRHEISTSIPPIAGPTITETPLHAVHVPMALDRSRPENVVVMIDSAPGTINAAATPCMNLPAINTEAFGATADTSAAAAKPAVPSPNTRQRLYASPSAPPTNNRLPKASMQAATTHCCSTKPTPKSLAISGKATGVMTPSIPISDDERTQAQSARNALG